MSVLARYFSSRRRRPTRSNRPRRLWWSCLCFFRCSVRSLIRLDSIATWTSGEPVSFSTVLWAAMIVLFCSDVSATNSPRSDVWPSVLVTRADVTPPGQPGVAPTLPAASPSRRIGTPPPPTFGFLGVAARADAQESDSERCSGEQATGVRHVGVDLRHERLDRVEVQSGPQPRDEVEADVVAVQVAVEVQYERLDAS